MKDIIIIVLFCAVIIGAITVYVYSFLLVLSSMKPTGKSEIYDKKELKNDDNII